MQSIMKNIAPPYDNSPCTKGEYRVVDDKIYLCKEDTSGVFDISKWEQVFLTDFIRGQLNENVESELDKEINALEFTNLGSNYNLNCNIGDIFVLMNNTDSSNNLVSSGGTILTIAKDTYGGRTAVAAIVRATSTTIVMSASSIRYSKLTLS